MQYRINIKNGDRISALGMGCMRLPKTVTGAIDQNKTKKLIDFALEQGINYFDVAYIYRGCEQALGEALGERRNKVKLATKLPLGLCKSYDDFDKFFNIQLKNLKTDYIDYYLMHMLSSCSLWKKLKKLGIEKWIAEKKASGHIKNIGFSFHGSRDEFFNLMDAYAWEFVLVQYNYLDENIQAGRAGVELCAQKGVPVFVMEPLRGGYLSSKLPKKAKAMLVKNKKSAADLALGWLWNQSNVTMVLSGMNEPFQITENVLTADKFLPDSMAQEDIKLIEKIKSEINKKIAVPCTGCGYCIPCPFGVQIPACFASRNTFAIKKTMGWQQYIVSTGLLTDNTEGAGNCRKCGKCEKHCPQGIKISCELGKIKRKMEPFWFPAAKWFIKRFLRPKEKKEPQNKNKE